MKRIEIKNAKHYCSGEKITVYIENGAFTDKLTGDADEIIDAEGLTLFPGLIDMHCHLREPGFEYREDIKSGTASAAWKSSPDRQQPQVRTPTQHS